MNSMPGPAIFADANFLLYVLDERDPAKQARAAAWHELYGARTGAAPDAGRFRGLRQPEANGGISNDAAGGLGARVALHLAWDPRPIDREELQAREVEHRYRISWWDSLIVAAAQMQDCWSCRPEDLHDGAAFGTLVVRSPFTRCPRAGGGLRGHAGLRPCTGRAGGRGAWRRLTWKSGRLGTRPTTVRR